MAGGARSPAAAARRTRPSSAAARLALERRRRHAARAGRVLDPEEGLRRADLGVRADQRRARASAFSQSFGASGSQSRAVDSGQPADVVAFSTTPDMTRLVKDGIVSSDWDANPEKGMSSDSVVVFVVRKGNPKHITGWDDLIKPGVDVITPNPSTSGQRALEHPRRLRRPAQGGQDAGAGARVRQDAADQERQRPGLERERARCRRSPAARATCCSTTRSTRSRREKAGDAVQYIIPKQTILIETPIAVTSKSSHATQAQAFVNWQWSPAGQTIWAQQGYRPVLAVGRQAVHERVPDAAAAVHDRLPGRLDEGQEASSSIPRRDRSRRSSRQRGCPLPPADAAYAAARPPRAGPPAPARVGRAGAALGLGLATLYMSVIVLIPLAAVVGQGVLRRARARSGTRSPTASR